SPGPEWAVDDTLDLVIRLREGDAAQALRDVADGRTNVEGAEQDLRELLDRFRLVPDNSPDRVRRLQSRPPTLDEATWYRQHTDWASAQLHRTLVVGFNDQPRRDKALAALEAHESVESVSIRRIDVLRYPPSSTRTTAAKGHLSNPSPFVPKDQSMASNERGKSTGNTVPQEHLNQLRIGQAWKIAEGWGLVGTADSGIYRNHSELKSFAGAASIGGNFIPGGNYLPALSENVAGHGQDPSNVDEFQYSNYSGSVPTVCDPNQDGWLNTEETYPGEGTGHGTHVAGLIAANAEDSQGVSGGCKHCGLAIIKTMYHFCFLGNNPPATASTAATLDTVSGTNAALDAGVQVINISAGSPNIVCGSSNSNVLCTTVKAAFQDDVFVSAASGNNRTNIQAPANGTWAAAIGGIQESQSQLTLWDKSPGSTVDCPFDPQDPGNEAECGSNYGPNGHPTTYQELMTLSVDVVSTVYPDREWNAFLGCGDTYGDGPANDGFGACTGTSMSAPQVSAVVGLIRSINPLVPVGAAKTTAPLSAGGIRKLLADTASRAQSGQAWDWKLGFGLPNAEAAARGMLGVKRAERVRNRAIPLFSLQNTSTGDTAAVATPQMAMSLNQYGYTADGVSIPPYTAFPNPGKGIPRARAYVLSTQVPPDVGTPEIIPLFLMVRVNGSSRDYILLSDSAQVQSASTNGYTYLGRQGYVYRHCAGISGCTQPTGTQTLNLQCKPGGSPCAVFPEGDRTTFQSRGFTEVFSSMASSRLGYAYARGAGNGDADSDGLPNALEVVLGTRTDIADTDGDGINDGAEYPFAGIPVSDPCDGPLEQRCTRSLRLFGNGFEE
ncbi:MAG: S8 family serine peptidase, partial [Planctomycetales bacterium]|nr:S8 family serine peptidase [Planctomycetales bacterium]